MQYFPYGEGKSNQFLRGFSDNNSCVIKCGRETKTLQNNCEIIKKPYFLQN